MSGHSKDEGLPNFAQIYSELEKARANLNRRYLNNNDQSAGRSSRAIFSAMCLLDTAKAALLSSSSAEATKPTLPAIGTEEEKDDRVIAHVEAMMDTADNRRLSRTEIHTHTLRRFIGLVKRAEGMQAALERAAAQFEFYAREHEAKANAASASNALCDADRAMSKARTNTAYAEMCREVIKP